MAGDFLKVLLVDDDAEDIILSVKALRNSKLLINLRTAFSGKEALEILRKEGRHFVENTPDLVILDYNMPTMTGLDVVIEMKSDEALRGIPVFVLTNPVNNEVKTKFLKAGAISFVEKPLDFRQFEKIVSTITNIWFAVVKLKSKPSGSNYI